MDVVFFAYGTCVSQLACHEIESSLYMLVFITFQRMFGEISGSGDRAPPGAEVLGSKVLPCGLLQVFIDTAGADTVFYTGAIIVLK